MPSVVLDVEKPSRGSYQDLVSIPTILLEKLPDSVGVEDLFNRGMDFIKARKYKAGIPYLNRAADLG
ncbi:hypothetical protein LCGC14_3050330, partial [marine sediment metagenome]